MLILAVTASASALTAIIVAFITYILTRRREHESDWRKLKLEKYQEFILAMSGIVPHRSTHEAQARFADATNSMSLVAPLPVLRALAEFQYEISPSNPNKTRDNHDRLLSTLLRAMRIDTHPNSPNDPQSFQFSLLDIGEDEER